MLAGLKPACSHSIVAERKRTPMKFGTVQRDGAGVAVGVDVAVGVGVGVEVGVGVGVAVGVAVATSLYGPMSHGEVRVRLS
jgi:hypothetical protein